MLTRLLTGRAATPRDEREQGGTTLRRPPSSTAWWSPRAHQQAHRVRHLGSGVQLPPALRALAHEVVVTEDGPHPLGALGAAAATCERLVLAGRATSLPFTAVLTGPQRTTTDNAEATATCGVPCFRRWQSCPIWLCKQGVVGSSPIISTAPQQGNGVVHRRQNVTCTAYVHPLRVRIEHPEPPMLTRQQRTRKAVPTTRADVRSVPATAVTTGWIERRGACCAVPSLARENRASEGD
jgi:hypothetical protein